MTNSQSPQPAQPVPTYVRKKPHFYYDPECGVLWFATEAEALAYAAESLKCFAKDAWDDGEWPSEVEDVRIGVATHATAEVGNDDDGYDYKVVQLQAAIPAPDPAPVVDLRKIAEQAGIRMNLWNQGAASMAYSDGCEGVTREHLERFAALYGFACWNAALAANPPNMQSFVRGALDSAFPAPEGGALVQALKDCIADIELWMLTYHRQAESVACVERARAALAAPAPQAPVALPDIDLCRLISSHEVYQYHPGALHEFAYEVIAEFCSVNGIPAPQTKEPTNDR